MLTTLPCVNALYHARKVSPTSRYTSIDALGGLIMIIMAINHASALIARQHSIEFWNGAINIYASSFAFFTRCITHLCAPGFFFLLGAGVYWFATPRRDSGWTESQTIRLTALRSFAKIVCIAYTLKKHV